MTDMNLYEHIRRLVREQKERQVINSQHDNFAQEYCKKQILKKKQVTRQTRRVSNLFKNFKKVQSYINIMDIINHLPLNLNPTKTLLEGIQSTEQLPEILPKTLQMRIKEGLGPILSKRYEEQQIKRQQVIQYLRNSLRYSNEELMEDSNFRQFFEGLNDNRLSDKLDLIDILRKDIKKKQIYFVQKKFDQQMQELSQEPEKVQNTKLFHKICSYLHMILEQQHKQKWASKKDKQMREVYRKQNIRQKFKIPTFVRNATQSIFKHKSSHHIRFNSSSKETVKTNDCSNLKMTNTPSKIQEQKENLVVWDQHLCQSYHMAEDNMLQLPHNNSKKKIQSRHQLLRQTFTFRKRGIKAKLMSKINEFAQGMTMQQKKNMQASKKYGRALNSLAEEIQYSYGRYEQQEIAEQEDIDEMKRYLDNTLTRNKRDLKRFHHR